MSTKTRFDLDAWLADLAYFLPKAKYIGTKVQDPLVRWSQAHRGPLLVCSSCKGAFTTLGMKNHRRACR